MQTTHENRNYETVVVFGPNLAESQVKQESKKLESLLEGNGAKGIKISRWGNKDVGYRLNKQIIGTFMCYAFSTDNSNLVDVINSNLRITDSILKFQSHRVRSKRRKVKTKTLTKRNNAQGLIDDDMIDVGENDELIL